MHIEPAEQTDEQTVKSESAKIHVKFATAQNVDVTKHRDCFGQVILRPNRCRELNVFYTAKQPTAFIHRLTGRRHAISQPYILGRNCMTASLVLASLRLDCLV